MLFDHLNELGIHEVNLDIDYYWNIPPEFAYDVLSEPGRDDLTIGQLSSDWRELRAQLDGETPILAYKFVWLASILRAIGETTSG